MICLDGCPCHDGCPLGCVDCDNKACSIFIYQNPILGETRGLRDSQYNSVIKFVGLDYAEPPVRFAAPVMKLYTDDFVGQYG